MSNPHLDSLDATIAAARTAWEAERKALQDQLFASQTELSLTKDAHKRADEARAAAERITMKLLTQFAIVSTVFAEARALAIKVGFDEEQSARNNSNVASLDAVETALTTSPSVGHNTGIQEGAVPPN